MPKDDDMPTLGDTPRDTAVAMAKGFIGLAPYVGSIVAEIVGTLIPNQRMERLEEYVRRLDARLSSSDTDALKEKASQPERIDLFEEGAYQAARALSSDRLDYISNIVATGLSGSEKERIEAKRMLQLLNAIDDDQVIILAGRLRRNWNNEEFAKRHENILQPVSAHLQSSQDERDRATMHSIARQELQRLGLLQINFKKPSSGKPQEFDDKTGMMKANGYDLSPIGRLLLRHVGLAVPGEF